VRITAAGVTPLDHTILSGKFHGSKAPLVLGNEGAGVVEDLRSTSNWSCDGGCQKERAVVAS
jgi:Zn-dependent alcohol dehydrogenase